MKPFVLFYSCFLCLKLGAQLRNIPLVDVEGKKYTLAVIHKPLTALVFLSPDCPLSQNYTLVLNSIQNRDVEIVGVFTGDNHKRSDINNFRKKYRIQFPLVRDPQQKLAEFSNATITPQVFLYDSNNVLVYKGAIDDWVISLGKKKQQAEQHYLQNAITGYLQHKKIEPSETKAVGCYISRK
jgi:peroxiredoxin